MRGRIMFSQYFGFHKADLKRLLRRRQCTLMNMYTTSYRDLSLMELHHTTNVNLSFFSKSQIKSTRYIRDSYLRLAYVRATAVVSLFRGYLVYSMLLPP